MPVPVLVTVYPVKARKCVADFPEAGQRQQKWMSPKKAATLVREKHLAKCYVISTPAFSAKALSLERCPAPAYL